MFIKPKQGIKIRDPFSKLHLPDEGREVRDDDIYWTRKLIDGDVVRCEPSSPPPAAVVRLEPIPAEESATDSSAAGQAKE